MGHSSTDLKFSVTICKSSELSSHSILKNMSKILISDLNKKGLFSNFHIHPNRF